ncbi:MAG: chromosomal replication initiator protein DnaA [Lentisphaeria bacterium]|nr:chromosomal replication initiator protein DnaA [Lentisphaeria bacterium]
MNKNTFTASEIWDLAAGRLKRQSDALYRMWFARMTAVSVVDDLLSLGVDNWFTANLIRDQYGDLLESALRDIHGRSYRYELVEGYELKPVPEAPAAVQPAPAAPAVPAAAAAKTPRFKPALYSFDNFVTGDNNRHACAMAKAVAKVPGEIYNPLFIYGTNGIGKTHLLQAIGHQITQDQPHLKVKYVTCDAILNEFYELLTNHRGYEFRSAFNDVDVLLIDDVHRLAKKAVLQEEFFNIFNTLYSENKQIVLTSDRQPCELADIDKRLSSRFEQGMTCQVGMPEYEEKIVILRMWREATLTRPPLSDKILEFLAENISSTVRRLKGCFLRLSAYAEMSGCEDLSIAEAENILHAQLAQESADKEITTETIQRTVANHFGVTLTDLIGRCRSRNIADSRMIAMYLCRRLTELSSTEIGSEFGRTHANVLHAEKTIFERCETDEVLRRTVKKLERQLQKR